MSLETVEEDIRNEAQMQAAEIHEETEERVAAIIADAEADAETILAERARAVDRRIEQEREQRLSSAVLEAKQRRLEARRDLLDEVRDSVERRIVNLAEERRRELTRLLLADAAEEFSAASAVRVFGRADDEALLIDLVSEFDGCEYAGEYDCLGGVIVESDESRVRINNTFDSFLEDVWEDNLKDLSTRLFENDQ